MPNRIVMGLVVTVLATAPVLAADMAGTWTIDGPVKPTCVLTQSGAQLSGSCKGAQAQGTVTGSVSGNDVSFVWTRNANADGGTMAPISFSGTIDANSIKGTAAMGAQTGPFTATRTAAAATAPAPQMRANADAPQAVWEGNPSGTMRHTLTHLECPLTSGNYLRTDYRMYDASGFDVSCGYDDRPAGARISIFLTSGNPATQQARFDRARATILQSQSGSSARDKATDFDSKLNWMKAGFTLSGGNWTDLYLTTLSGWFFEIRATYSPDGAPAVAKAIAELSAQVEKTAAPHIAACATVPVAVPLNAHTGKRLTAQDPANEPNMQKLAVSGAAVSKIALAERGDKGAAGGTPDWCAYLGFGNTKGSNFILWRNIGEAGNLGGVVERVTGLTQDITVYIVSDKVGSGTVLNSSGITDVLADRPDTIDLLGVFDGRPSLDDLGKLVLSGTPSPLYASINKKDGKITVFKPF